MLSFLLCAVGGLLVGTAYRVLNTTRTYGDPLPGVAVLVVGFLCFVVAGMVAL